jgi:hypothetical protein
MKDLDVATMLVEGVRKSGRQLTADECAAILDDLAARLMKGSRAAGLRLTANECARYAAALPKPKRGRGRPPDDPFEKYVKGIIGTACVEREREGMSVEEAITATAQEYGVSKSTVRDRRRSLIIPGRRKRPNIDYLQLPTNK